MQVFFMTLSPCGFSLRVRGVSGRHHPEQGPGNVSDSLDGLQPRQDDFRTVRGGEPVQVGDKG